MHKFATTLLLLTSSCFYATAGYTHYWTWHGPASNAAVAQCVADMNRLIEARKAILVSPDLEGAKPGELKLQPTNVDFNGFGPNACEPFVFPGQTGFNFCKTRAEPYDEVVTACLIVARDHFPPSVLEISSDGEWADWNAGAKLYSAVFHKPARDPMHGTGTAASLGLGSAILISIVLFMVLGWGFFLYKRLGS